MEERGHHCKSQECLALGPIFRGFEDSPKASADAIISFSSERPSDGSGAWGTLNPLPVPATPLGCSSWSLKVEDFNVFLCLLGRFFASIRFGSQSEVCSAQTAIE